MRVCIVGGGILGLSLGRLLSLEWPEASIVVLEKEPDVALHQTGRNSGVVHAGLYYEPGSLKARLCRRGVGLMQDYCRNQGIPYQECGKVVVATDAGELPALEALAERARDPRRPHRRPGARLHRSAGHRWPATRTRWSPRSRVPRGRVRARRMGAPRME